MSAGTQQLDRWRRSAQFRAIARAQCLKLNAEFALRPRCGAKKRNGEPCQIPASANGRCWRHGGRTPKGEAWHRPRWPNRDAPDLEQKLAAKLKKQAKAAKRRAAKVAAMTPERRAQYEAWQRTHRPGDPGKRATERERRRHDQEAWARLKEWDSAPPQPPSGELALISAEIEFLRQQLADRKAARESRDDPTLTFTTGVFA